MGDGFAKSSAAGAVILAFLLAALLYKFFYRLYKRRDEAVAAVQTAYSREITRISTGSHKAGVGADLEKNELESGCEGSSGRPSLDSTASCQALCSSAQPAIRDSGRRPQTPAEVIASRTAALAPIALLQPASSAHTQGQQSLSSPTARGMATAPRPRSPSTFLERPQSRGSAWSDDMRNDPSRPWSTPSKELQETNWWAEAREWWPEAVASKWESPYRPSTRSSRHRDFSRAVTPASSVEVQSVWPCKLEQPEDSVFTWSNTSQRPKYRWSSSNSMPRLEKAADIDNSPLAEPPPLPGSYFESARDPWDGDDMPSVAARCNTAQSEPSVRVRQRGPTDIPVRLESSPVQGVHQTRPSNTSCCHDAPPLQSAPSPKATWLPKWRGLSDFFATGKQGAGKPGPGPAHVDEVNDLSAEDRIAVMQQELNQTRAEPLAERKRVFRELQRHLHPDKNVDCAEAAKMAFQELMLQRGWYLSQ